MQHTRIWFINCISYMLRWQFFFKEGKQPSLIVLSIWSFYSFGILLFLHTRVLFFLVLLGFSILSFYLSSSVPLFLVHVKEMFEGLPWKKGFECIWKYPTRIVINIDGGKTYLPLFYNEASNCHQVAPVFPYILEATMRFDFMQYIALHISFSNNRT